MSDDEIRVRDIRDSEAVAIGDHVQAASARGNVFQFAGELIFGPKITHIYNDPTISRARRDKLVLLEKVKRAWISGVLENSVHVAAWIDLGKADEGASVQHPWDMLLDTSDEGRRPLPPNKSILEIFEEREHALLILGAPGSGKTISLLELARDAIARAENARADADPPQPVPVVLNLSSWAAERKSLATWLVDELNAKYQLPRKHGRLWIENSDLLLLLDGLDEVASEHQAACVKAINDFRAEHGLCGIAECSRAAEYDQLPTKLRLSGAIRLQPITETQIEQYLAAGGAELTSLRGALAGDASLRQLATSPLMLSVMTIAYRGMPTAAIVSDRPPSPDARRGVIFDAYIKAMFRRITRTNKDFYSQEQTLHYLSWLARQLQRHSQTVFLIEQIQPNWLSTTGLIWIYVVVSRILVGLIMSVGIWVLIRSLLVFDQFYLNPQLGLFPITIVSISSELIYHHPQPGIFQIQLTSILIMITGSIMSAVFSMLSFRRRSADIGASLRLRVIYLTIYASLIVSIGWIIWSNSLLGLGVNDWREHFDAYTKIAFLIYPAIFLILGWKCITLNIDHDIHIIERIRWSMRRSLLGALLGFLIGIAITILERVVWYRPIWPITVDMNTFVSYYLDLALYTLEDTKILLLFFLCISVPIGLTLGGISGVSIGRTIRPNQGIHGSAKSAVRIAALMGLWVWAIIVGCTFTPTMFSKSFLAEPVAFGLLAACTSGIWFGGCTYIQHFILRTMLFISGGMPWRYARFLDYAGGLTFLQRVGGGYIFMHRLLLEHLASLAAA